MIPEHWTMPTFGPHMGSWVREVGGYIFEKHSNRYGWRLVSGRLSHDLPEYHTSIILATALVDKKDPVPVAEIEEPEDSFTTMMRMENGGILSKPEE